MRIRFVVGVALALGLALAAGVYFQPRVGVPLAQGTSRTSNSPLASSLIAQDATPQKGIAVVGEGSVTVAPDMAIVSAGVQTRAQTAKDAQAQNSTAMSTVLAQIKALGIAEKDIQTSGISLYPVNDNNNQPSGYQAINTVTVRVQDVASAGAVLDAATGAGANTNVSIRFGLKDSSAAKSQALEAAAKDAQGKAAAIAKGIGVQLGAVESAVEESSSPVPASDVRLVAAAAPSVPVQPGELTVTAQVRVTYSY